MFHIKNALLSLLLNFALEYAIRKVKVNHKLLKFDGTHQVIINADDVNLWGQNICCFMNSKQHKSTIHKHM